MYTSHVCWRLLTEIVVGVLLAATGAAQNQLPNLPDTPTTNRFALTDRVWPANPGEAAICLWADDKIAAMSFTVDDNCYANVAWWQQQGALYGFKITWFLITDRISVNNNPNFNGTWEQWRAVHAAGHDLQSHTAYHLHVNDPGWPGIDGEYRISQEQIEANIPGHKCDFLAYPGGTYSYTNDRAVASLYYGAARGVTGGFNQPHRTDYFSTKSHGWPMSDPTTNPASSNPNSLFNAADSRYYRGWAVYVSHLISDTNTAVHMLNWMDANRTNVWSGLFSEVAKYGQERDTATLITISNTTQHIVLTLTDQMLDSRFNYPLTIKVRLPAAWPDVAATQNTLPVETNLLEHNGGRFALVQAVPDRGPIMLVSPSLDSDADGLPDGWMNLHFGHVTGQAADRSRPGDDADGDGQTNAQEYRAGTHPRDPASRLGIHAAASAGNDFAVRFSTVTGKQYRVEHSADLLAWPGIVADSVSGTGGDVEVLDPGAAVLPRRFYRVLVLP